MTSNVLIVAGEVFPLAKTGGLADAVGGMSQALLRQGVALQVLLPAYRGVRARVDIRRQWALAGLPGGPARLLEGRCLASGLPCLLLDNPALYDRDGIYVDEQGCDYADNAARYAALAHAAAAIAAGIPGLAAPDIVHAHDWHAGLVPLLARAAAPAVSTVLTIHNLAFHGSFPLEARDQLGLPEALWGAPGLLAWERLNFLQAGIVHADRVTTVSRHYAQEVLQPAGGCGLDAALRARGSDFLALPNGIDAGIWDPASDPHLGEARYDAQSLRSKGIWKARIQRDFGLAVDPHALLLISCSRLTGQKLADLTLQALPRAFAELPGLQFAVLGKGEARYEADFRALSRAHPGRCGVHVGYDEAMAHRLQAGGDALWHPSRFEPFGLTPLYSMRYGTVPVATAVGGLMDTIQDPGAQAPAAAMMAANGLLFTAASAEDMVGALRRIAALHRNEVVWRAMQRNAMNSEHSWSTAVRGYLQLYAALRGRAPQIARGRPGLRMLRPAGQAVATRVGVAHSA